MKRVIVKNRGLFGDRYEMIEIEESGDAIAALLTLLFLPIIIVAVVGFYLLKLAVGLTIAIGLHAHRGIDDTFDELHTISPIVSGVVVTALIMWSLLLLLKALGVGG